MKVLEYIKDLNEGKNIESIDLGYEKVGDEEIKGLAKALETNTTVKTINLCRNNIGKEGLKALEEALKCNTSVTDIDLRKANYGDDLDFVPWYGHNPKIESYIGRNKIQNCLKNKYTYLDLKRFPIGVEGAKILAEGIKQSTSLKEIDLWCCYIGDEGLKIIAEALKVNTSITKINLMYNKLTSEGAKILAEVIKHNNSLKDICLYSNNIGEDGFEVLVEAVEQNKSLLDIGHDFTFNSKVDNLCKRMESHFRINRIDDAVENPKFETYSSYRGSISSSIEAIGEEGAIYLAEKLKKNTSIKKIELGSNNIGVEGAKALAEALKVNTSVNEINLSNCNKIGDEGVKALAEALRVNTSLEKINLCNNDIGSEGTKALVDMLKVNTSIIEINLSDNYGIGEEGAKALAEALKDNTSIIEINLEKTGYYDKTIANTIKSYIGRNKIQNIVKDSNIEKVDFKDFHIGEKGILTVVDILKKNIVTSIDLTSNDIGDGGMKVLAEALKTNTSLKTIDLSSNNITNAGVKTLANALKHNTSITTIDLSNNNDIGDEGAKGLIEALQINTFVTKMHVGQYRSYGYFKDYDANHNIETSTRNIISDYICRNEIYCFFKNPNLGENKEKASFYGCGDEGVKVLVDMLKQNSFVTNLYIGDSTISAEKFKMLVETLKSNTTLTSISISGNNIGNNEANIFVDIVKYNPRIISASIRNDNSWGSKIDENILKEVGYYTFKNKLPNLLSTNDVTKISTWDLGCYKTFGDKEAEALAEILKKNTFVLSLDLDHNCIGDDGAKALADMLKYNKSITSISLRFKEESYYNDTRIGSEGAKALAEALKQNTSVTKIILDGHRIGPEGAKALAEALKQNASITSIQIGNNDIGPEGIKALAEALKQNTSITHIGLLGNKIDYEGIKALAEALKQNTSITRIDLFGCHIGNAGVEALIEVLEQSNLTLEYIDLARNKNIISHGNVNSDYGDISDTMLDKIDACILKSKLRKLLQDSTLKEIKLGQHDIRMGNEGAKVLAEVLKHNTSVTYVEFPYDNNVGDEGAQDILEALQSNNILTKISFGEKNNISWRLKENIEKICQKNMQSAIASLFTEIEKGIESVQDKLLANKNLDLEDKQKIASVMKQFKGVVDEQKLEKQKTITNNELAQVINKQNINDEVLKALTEKAQKADQDKEFFMNAIALFQEQLEAKDKKIEAMEQKMQLFAVQQFPIHNVNDEVKHLIIPQNNNTTTNINQTIPLNKNKDITKNLSTPCCKCNIFSQMDIVYKNNLLNHPELFKNLSYSLSKTLDLSQKLSTDLINYVIENHNSEILLAGLMSVDYN